MINVIFRKNDPYMGKEMTKTHLCATEDKARAKAAAIASVNKVPAHMISEEKDADGVLLQIIIDASPVVSAPVLSSNDEIEQLKARVERLEQFLSSIVPQ